MKNGEERVWAVIGDLEGSRDLAADERSRVQDALLTALEDLSTSGLRGLMAPLAVTAGDEFEGLFRTPAALPGLAIALGEAVGPHRLRFGLGFGALSVELPADFEERRVGELDGPCFHGARDAVQRAAAEDLWIALDEGLGAPWIDSLAELLAIERGSWTEKQALTVALARAGRTQAEIAEQLGVSPSVISERLKAAHAEPCWRAEEALAGALEDLDARLRLDETPSP